MLAGQQRVEVGDAIDAKDDRLAVDHKLLDAVLQGGLGDPGISPRPVIAAARDQPHPIAVALDADAEAVMLDFGESDIRQHQAGTTPFSPLSVRGKGPTLPRGAAGGTWGVLVLNSHVCGDSLTALHLGTRGV